MNWSVHSSRRFGVAGVNLQDVCITENEGPAPILDRTKENLCSGDLSVIKAREMLLAGAHALQNGVVPLGARDPGVYRVRGCAAALDEGADWMAGVREQTTVPPLHE